MCEIAISCLQKCPQASVLRAPRKKRSRFLRPPLQVGSENLGCSGACLWELQMDSWMLLLDSAKVWEVGEEEKEEAGGWRKIREAGEPRKNSVGKEQAGGRKMLLRRRA